MKSGKRIFKYVIILLAIIVVFIGAVYLFVVPKKDTIPVEGLPTAFICENENNYVQFQSGDDCAGYASAYVLRHLGEEIEGEKLYDSMVFRVGDGVSLRGVRKAFADYGYDSVSYTGTIDTLKMHLIKGVPVVALITIKYNGREGHHYVAVVGYDEDFIYLADSTGASSNTVGHTEYNRRVTYEQFEKLWQTNVYPVNNIYTVVKSKTGK